MRYETTSFLIENDDTVPEISKAETKRLPRPSASSKELVLRATKDLIHLPSIKITEGERERIEITSLFIKKSNMRHKINFLSG